MARRATYFFDVFKPESPSLLVSGGWEFLEPETLKKPDPKALRQLSKAYELMMYDVAFIGKEESARLAQLDVKPDKGRLSLQEGTVTSLTTSDGHRICFIRFPSLKNGEDIPSPNQLNQISAMIKHERDNAELLIGLTDWGWVGEREYIGQAPQYMPDLLLGSGYGPGVTGRFDTNRRCAWYRPYDKGRTIVEVQVFAWPNRTKPTAWPKQNAIRSISIGLGDKYLDNPEVNALFQ